MATRVHRPLKVTDVTLFSETRLKPNERFFLSRITTSIEPTATWEKKAELPLQLERHSQQPCRPYPPRPCFRSELLRFRRKSILAGDLIAKHPFWNSAV
jgi:hypothetical protein